MNDIRVFLAEQADNPNMLFLDERLYDGALCGTICNEHGNYVAVYDENLLISILADMLDSENSMEEAYEYYLFNIYGANMGGHTPKFINLLHGGKLYGGFNK